MLSDLFIEEHRGKFNSASTDEPKEVIQEQQLNDKYMDGLFNCASLNRFTNVSMTRKRHSPSGDNDSNCTHNSGKSSMS